MLKTMIRKFSILALITILLVTSSTGVCYAASTSTVSKTAKEVDASMRFTYKNVNSKATKVKLGTTNLTFKRGYLKFTAPKKGSYQFSFSNLSGKEDYSSAGFFFYKVKTYKKTKLLRQKKVYTEGGKTYIVRICKKKAEEYFNEPLSSSSSSSSKRTTTNTYLKSRTAKLTLSKKQTIYVYAVYFPEDPDSDSEDTKWGTVRMTIQRV